MTTTWDDIADASEEKVFVGRENELHSFHYELLQEEPRKLLFFISGQGGVGKTTLLQRFQAEAKKNDFLIAETDDSQPDLPTVLGHLSAQFINAGYKFDPFAERYRKYCQLREEIEADPNAPQEIVGIFASTTIKLGFSVLDEIPFARQATRYVNDEARNKIAEQSGQWADYVARKFSNKDEVALVKNPIHILAPLFVATLNKIAERNRVLLCFDNFEQTRRYLDPWFIRLRTYKPSVNIRIVIASRALTGLNWEPLQVITQHIPLDVFTSAEAEQFLTAREIKEPARRHEIIEFSGRLPILMEWLSAPTTTTPDPALPTADLVDRFLRWVTEPVLRSTVLTTAIPRHFDLDLTALLINKPNLVEAEVEFEWLRRLPGVTQREAGWQYHEVIRRYMLDYQRSKSVQIYRQTHAKLAAYYDEKRSALQLKEESIWSNETWRQLTLDYFYHHLAANPNGHWVDFLTIFTLALRERVSYAEHLLDLWLQPATSSELKSDQIDTLKGFMSQVTAIEADSPDDIKDIFDRLAELLPDGKARAIAFAGHGVVNYRKGQFLTAISKFDYALTQYSTDALTYANRGECYRLLGRDEDALTDFDHAIKLDPDNALSFAYRGLIYKQLDRYDEAIVDLTHSIELDAEVSWVFAIRGETYQLLGNYEEAIADFSHYLEISGNYAWALTRRSEAYRQLGKDELASADLKRSHELSEFAHRSLASSTVGQLALQFLEKSRKDGKEIEIPKLDIKLN